MAIDALLVISVMVGAVLAVRGGLLSAATAAMAGLCLVTIGGVMQPTEAVQGFAHPVLLALGSLYIVAAGLRKTRSFEAMARADWSGPWIRRAEEFGVDHAVRRAVQWLPGSDLEAEPERLRRDRWLVGVAAAGLLLGPITGLVRIEVAALFGAMLVIATGVLSAEGARRVIDWDVIVLVGALLGYGRAFEVTGAAEMIGAWMPSIEPALGASVSVFALLAFAMVLSALTQRKAAASIIPLALSAGLFLASGSIV